MSKRLGALSAQMIDRSLPAGWKEIGTYTDWSQGDMARTSATNQNPKSDVRMRYNNGTYIVEIKK